MLTKFIRGIECFDEVVIESIEGIVSGSVRYNLSSFEAFGICEDEDVYYKCSLIIRDGVTEPIWRKASKYDVIPQFTQLREAEEAHMNNRFTQDNDWETSYWEECEDMNRYAVDDDIYSDYSTSNNLVLNYR